MPSDGSRAATARQRRCGPELDSVLTAQAPRFTSCCSGPTCSDPSPEGPPSLPAYIDLLRNEGPVYAQIDSGMPHHLNLLKTGAEPVADISK
jgi:hypothetical protein